MCWNSFEHPPHYFLRSVYRGRHIDIVFMSIVSESPISDEIRIYIFSFYESIDYPVDTRRRLNVYKTSIRHRRFDGLVSI